jgi:hypothetical protein
MRRRTEKVTPGQRALWTFLLVSLVAPFLAALIVLVAAAIAGLTGRWAPAFQGAPLSPLQAAVSVAVSTYVWSAIPAAVAGAATAAYVAWRGVLPWLMAATACVVVFGIAAVLSGAVPPAFMTGGAFLAACVGVICRAILARANVIE